MSDIILVKENVEVTTEVKRVEVPDYQPRFEAIEELKGVAARSQIEATKTIEVLGDSIVEQIACYLNELFKPLFKYCKNSIPFSTDLKWCSNNWTLEAYGPLGGTGIRLRDYSNRLRILFNSDGYTIEEEGDIQELIVSLAYNWKDFKRYTQKNLNSIITGMQNKQEAIINRNEDNMNTLMNFEL